ncbi:hypothetical protein JL722_7839 [Aureococcus anophagefferens]|nr:hypothetical protein JL722_7839 [Aureococcus anophagefferens]
MASFFDFASWFGPELRSGADTKPTSQVLGGKAVVGLYFSAHWCPPCRGFTPKLAALYEALVAAGESFEVVFVSSDRDDAQFDEYYGAHPWAAVPFANRDAKAALSRKFKVQGIPTFVLVDGETGELITADGRDVVLEDPSGAGFPWRPPSLRDALDALPPLEGKGPGGPGPTFGSLPGPVLLYFSAHWCPPCRQFTPQLVAFFSRLKAAHPAASLVFVSSDKSEHEFAEYFADMGDEWLALPFAARGAKDRLSQLFGVRGIRRSRSSLVVFAEAMADPSAAIGALKALAAKHAAVDPPELLFFFAELPEGPVDKVRELCGIAGLQGRAETADLVLLDIPDDGGFYLREKVASVDVAALEAFLASPGDRKQLEAG